jgi:HSP20 family protein
MSTKLPIRIPSSAVQRLGLRSWNPFESHQHEMDRLIDDLGGGAWPLLGPRTPMEPPGFAGPRFAMPIPAIDVTENDNAYEIVAELPGMDEKNVDVTLANGVVTIKGEKKEEREEKKKGYYLSERSFGSFARSLRLPDGVDAAKIDATFKNGILTITLPKTAEAKESEKKITIKGG